MWLILILSIIAAFAYYSLKPNSSSSDGSKKKNMLQKSELPNKAFNPSVILDHPEIIMWEFQAPNLSTACEYAHNNASVRKKANDCIKLPIDNCTSANCACFYRPIYESRSSQRRNSNDRRESFRFTNTCEDRRVFEDRRKGNLDWHDKHIK